MKKNKHTILLTAVLLSLMYSTAATANSTNNNAEDGAPRVIRPYGENPNLAHVLGYKTQEGVISTAQKVGTATEKGVAKIKPSVDQAWENTKAITQRSTAPTKDAAHSNTPHPLIQQQPLSQSTDGGLSPHSPASSSQNSSQTGATSYAVNDL
jgi:hypothetical protein